MKNLIFIALSAVLLWSCNSIDNNNTKDQNQTPAPENKEETTLEVDEDESIKLVVLNLFDGVRESNKEKISSALATDAEFISAKKEDGALVEKITKGIDFVEKAGAEHEKTWDERLSDIQVEVKENTGQLKANYQFFLGKEYSHKGEMTVDLSKNSGQWLIHRVWYTVVKE